MDAIDVPATKLAYFDDTWRFQSAAILLSHVQTDDGRDALLLDSTIFHPQGGGQPSDTGAISSSDGDFKFLVHDVRLKDGVAAAKVERLGLTNLEDYGLYVVTFKVFHYGVFDTSVAVCAPKVDRGKEVFLCVDNQRRIFNARLHSAGHLLDVCMRNVGLDHLEAGKGYHFPDGPFVEYKGVILQNELQIKQKELETEANTLISIGGKVSAAVLPYEEASKLCGGTLPDYISKGSKPRIVSLGNYPGCPCGGTHVADISEIRNLKVTLAPRKG